MYDFEKFRAALEARMKQKDVSGRQLALKSGLKESVVNSILRGQSQDPRISTVAAIADELGCTVDDLLPKHPLRLVSSHQSTVDTELLKIAIDSVNGEVQKQGLKVSAEEWTKCVAEIYERLESANTGSDTVKKAIKLVLMKK